MSRSHQLSASHLIPYEFQASNARQYLQPFIDEIREVTGIHLDIKLSFDNLNENIARADFKDGSARITFDQEFVWHRIHAEDAEANKAVWAIRSVLAHEFAHLVNNHPYHVNDTDATRPLFEIEADIYSGWVLFQLGAPLNVATNVLFDSQLALSDVDIGTRSHDIRIGWLRARAHAKREAALARYGQQLNRAWAAWENGKYAEALDILELTIPGPFEQDLRSIEWYRLWSKLLSCNLLQERVALGQLTTSFRKNYQPVPTEYDSHQYIPFFFKDPSHESSISVQCCFVKTAGEGPVVVAQATVEVEGVNQRELVHIAIRDDVVWALVREEHSSGNRLLILRQHLSQSKSSSLFEPVRLTDADIAMRVPELSDPLHRVDRIWQSPSGQHIVLASRRIARVVDVAKESVDIIDMKVNTPGVKWHSDADVARHGSLDSGSIMNSIPSIRWLNQLESRLIVGRDSFYYALQVGEDIHVFEREFAGDALAKPVCTLQGRFIGAFTLNSQENLLIIASTQDVAVFARGAQPDLGIASRAELVARGPGVESKGRDWHRIHHPVNVGHPIESIIFSKDEARVAIMNSGGEMTIWRLEPAGHHDMSVRLDFESSLCDMRLQGKLLALEEQNDNSYRIWLEEWDMNSAPDLAGIVSRINVLTLSSSTRHRYCETGAFYDAGPSACTFVLDPNLHTMPEILRSLGVDLGAEGSLGVDLEKAWVRGKAVGGDCSLLWVWGSISDDMVHHFVLVVDLSGRHLSAARVFHSEEIGPNSTGVQDIQIIPAAASHSALVIQGNQVRHVSIIGGELVSKLVCELDGGLWDTVAAISDDGQRVAVVEKIAAEPRPAFSVSVLSAANQRVASHLVTNKLPCQVLFCPDGEYLAILAKSDDPVQLMEVGGRHERILCFPPSDIMSPAALVGEIMFNADCSRLILRTSHELVSWFVPEGVPAGRWSDDEAADAGLVQWGEGRNIVGVMGFRHRLRQWQSGVGGRAWAVSAVSSWESVAEELRNQAAASSVLDLEIADLLARHLWRGFGREGLETDAIVTEVAELLDRSRMAAKDRERYLLWRSAIRSVSARISK